MSFGGRGKEGEGRKEGEKEGPLFGFQNNRAALRLGTRFSSRSGTSLSLFSFSLRLLFTNQSPIYFFFSFFFDVCALSSLSHCFKDETRSDPHRKNCLKLSLSLWTVSRFSLVFIIHRERKTRLLVFFVFGAFFVL